MAVEPAKNVFHQKSITEHIIAISKRLGCFNTMVTIIPDNKDNDTTDEYIKTENKLTFYMKQLNFLRLTSNNLLQMATSNALPIREISIEDKEIYLVKKQLNY